MDSNTVGYSRDLLRLKAYLAQQVDAQEGSLGAFMLCDYNDQHIARSTE